MQQTDSVIEAFDSLGGSSNQVNALVFALAQRARIPETQARQLVDLAVQQGRLQLGALGQLRKP